MNDDAEVVLLGPVRVSNVSESEANIEHLNHILRYLLCM